MTEMRLMLDEEVIMVRKIPYAIMDKRNNLKLIGAEINLLNGVEENAGFYQGFLYEFSYVPFNHSFEIDKNSSCG